LFFEASAAAIAGHPTTSHSGAVCGFIADRTRNRYGVSHRNRFRIALRASGMTTKAGERSTWTEGGA
jgi:hypothetical protein